MSITTKFIPHSLIGIVSVLPALLVMPAVADTITTRQELDQETGDFSGDNFSVLTSYWRGGALYNSDGDLTLGGTVSENAIFNGNAATSYGGALHNGGRATINYATFINNKSLDFDNHYATSYGGAISNFDDEMLDANVKLVISNTTFGDATDAGKGNLANMGGAIYNVDEWQLHTLGIPELADFETRTTLTNTNFYYNKAIDTNDDHKNIGGGAIYNKAHLDVNGDTLFKGNTATGHSANGGAIYNAYVAGGSVITFNDTVTFDSNIATDDGAGNGSAGGAIYNFDSSAGGAATIIFNDLATFTGNKALSAGSLRTVGGGIYTTGGDITFGNGAVFTGNEAYNGAAIYSEGGRITITDGSFTNNIAGGISGAIHNTNRVGMGGDLISEGVLTINALNDNVAFSGNKANGVANDIYNSAVVNLNAAATKSITLEGIAGITDGTSKGLLNINSAAEQTGTVSVSDYIVNQTVTLSKGTLSLGDEALVGSAHINVAAGATLNAENGGSFVDSSADKGGAIYNEGTLTMGDGISFVGNSAVAGGAIYNDETGTVEIGNDAVFTDNTSEWRSSGAFGGSDIKNFGTVEIGDNARFTRTEYKDALYTDWYDTAIYSDKGSLTIGNDATFKNIAQAINTAIGTYSVGNNATFDHNGSVITNFGGTHTVGNNATFKNSQFAVLVNRTADGSIAIGENATFENNKGDAEYLGGNGSVANNYIANTEMSFGNGLVVKNNTTPGNGVIYNVANATMTFGTSSFVGNSAANGGAIYNVGDVTFAGTNTFSGNTANGVANDIYNTGTLTFATDSTTTMNGGITGAGALAVNGNATLSIGSTSVTQNTLTLDGTINADLNNADDFAFFDITDSFTGNGNINLTLKSIGEYNVFKHAVFDSNHVTFADSSVFTYNWNDAGDTIMVTTKSANEIVEALDVDVVSANTVVNLASSEDTTAQEIGRVLSAALAEGDTEYVEHEIKKLAPEEKPVTHSVASSVQNQVLTLTANRMSAGMAAGRAGGDEINADYGFWAQGMYNKSRYLGEFDGQSRGVAVGFDALIEKMYTIGVGYAFSRSDIDMNGDRGSMDIDSHTVFVYGQYKPSKWFINATLSNTVSKYTEKTVVGLTPVETNYDVNSFGIQTMTGYDFTSGITPMVGMRYLHVSTDGHERLLGYVDDSQSSFLSAVGGMKYAFDIQDTGDVRWTPELRALATYDVISDKNGATVYVPGGSIYHVAGDRMSRGGGELGMGLTMEWRGLELSLNYDLQLRKDYLSHTGMVKLRYEF